MAARKREAKSRLQRASPRTRPRSVIEEAGRPDSAAPLPVVAVGASADGVVVILIDVDALKRDQEIRRRQS